MEHSYWNNLYAGWGWFLWIGIWFLLISSFGNWGYTYKVHRRYGDISDKTALDILNERYAKGEIDHEEFYKIRNDISTKKHKVINHSKQKISPTTNSL